MFNVMTIAMLFPRELGPSVSDNEPPFCESWLRAWTSYVTGNVLNSLDLLFHIYFIFILPVSHH